MQKIFTIFILIMIFSFSLILDAEATAQGAVNFALGIPQKEFRDNLEENAFGFGGNLGLKIGNSPLIIGGDLTFLNYGSDERDEAFSMTIPEVTVRVETKNNMFMGHLLLRLHPFEKSPVQPYFDGLLGFNYLYTETQIKNDDEEDEVIASSKNWEDTVLSYGYGGGLMISLFREEMEKGSDLELLIDARVRYLYGGQAQYLKEGSIIIEKYGNVTYEYLESETDLLIVQIGVSVNF